MAINLENIEGIELAKTFYAYTKAIKEVEDLIKSSKEKSMEGFKSTSSYQPEGGKLRFEIVNFQKNNDSKVDELFVQKKNSYTIDYEKIKNEFPEAIVKTKVLRSVPQIVSEDPNSISSLKEIIPSLKLKQTKAAKEDSWMLSKKEDILESIDLEDVYLPDLLIKKDALKDDIIEIRIKLLRYLKEIDQGDCGENVVDVSLFVNLVNKPENQDITDIIMQKGIEFVVDKPKNLFFMKNNNFDTYKKIEEICEEKDLDLEDYASRDEIVSLLDVDSRSKCDRMDFAFKRKDSKEEYLSKYVECISSGMIEEAETLRSFYNENQLSKYITSSSFKDALDGAQENEIKGLS